MVTLETIISDAENKTCPPKDQDTQTFTIHSVLNRKIHILNLNKWRIPYLKPECITIIQLSLLLVCGCHQLQSCTGRNMS